MGNPELSHQIGQTAHNVKEAGRALLDSNLFQNLQDLGHPYGLLLGNAARDSSLYSLIPEKKELSLLGPSKEDLIDSSLIAPLGGSLLGILGGFGALSWLASWGWSVKDISDTDESLSGYFFSVSGVLAFALRLPEKKLELFALAPMFLKLLATKDITPERQRKFHIGRSGVSLGTTSIRLKDYKGDQPFSIKTPEGEPVTQINPGDVLGSVHVSQQASFLKRLTPLEKVNAVTGDLLALFGAIEETGLTDIPAKAQQTLEKAKSATIIGISHLVRLFRRKTGLSTWKLDVLPEAVQNFHRFDSQAVSDRFGGGRKVKPKDIEMLVITPAQRQMLAATA